MPGMDKPAQEIQQQLAVCLAGLANFEQSRQGAADWSLDNMQTMLSWPGGSLPTGLAIQVGGSKGKGSTVLYLEALARAAGLHTGAYLSPHLYQVNERIRLDGQSLSDANLLAALQPILTRAAAEQLQPSYFEVLTAAAMRAFAASAVELCLLEVGLGGRLDATTAVPVDASIITGIELEHTDVLGDSIQAIAAEKAAIMRPGKPAFTAAQGEALQVIQAHARKVGADLQVMGQDFGIRKLQDHKSHWTGTLWDRQGAGQAFHLPQASAFELTALALAFASLRCLLPQIDFPLAPVPRPTLPGRFQEVVCADGQALILDGSHTLASMTHLAAELQRRYSQQLEQQGLTVLYASAQDKHWSAALRPLWPLVDRFLVTELSGVHCADPEEIVSWLRSQGAQAEVVSDVATGKNILLRSPGLRLVTGSFYLMGAFRELAEAGDEAESL